MREFVTVAFVVKTRGIRGEVVADILTDVPDRFQTLRSVRACKEHQESWEELESFWFQKGRVVLKFVGRDRPQEAEPLVGCELQVPAEDRPALPEDHFFDSDLQGCRVLQQGVLLGSVRSLLKAGESTLLVVETPDGREILIPWVRAFVTAVHLADQEIRVELPPGLIELATDAPSRPKGRNR